MPYLRTHCEVSDEIASIACRLQLIDLVAKRLLQLILSECISIASSQIWGHGI